MSATTNKLKYIKPSVDTYTNLGEELKDLHKKSNDNNDNISAINSTIDTLTDSVNNAVESVKDSDAEVVEARGSCETLNDRLSNMELFKATQILERLSLQKQYDYNSNGDIQKEKIRGQLNYDIVYSYDDKGNIIREEFYDIENALLGSKQYEYDEHNNISKSTSVNGEILAIVTNSYITNDIDSRLKKIENIDFIKLAKVLSSDSATTLMETMQDLVARVATLEMMLPGNITNIGDLPYITNKIQELEDRLNSKSIYEFTVDENKSEYYIPTNIPSNSAVYIDGLQLDEEDYTLSKDKISLNIQLIDGLTITIKY